MVGLRRIALVSAVVACAWPAPAADAANLKAKTSLTTKSGATRIVAVLSSAKRVPRRARPRAVRVKVGGRAYRLSRVRGSRVAAVRLGSWRSEPQRGAAGRRLLGLAGKRVAVIVRSRAGTTKLRSRLVAPSVTPPAEEPAGGDTTPGGDSPMPGGTQTGDITGQAAIDQMTAQLRDASARRYQTSGDLSETFELHLCGDGRFRYYHHQSYSGVGPLAVEKFGQPWTVVEALIRADGYRGARIQGTFTQQNSLKSGQQAINEPAEAVIEYSNGQWYWDQQPVETGAASCDPSF